MRVLAVLRKELREIVRDRRSLFSGLFYGVWGPLVMAIALVRYQFFGRRGANLLIVLPMATPEIVLQRHLGCGIEAEALVTGRGFSFRAGERVFLMGFRMQEHGKIPANGFVAEGQHRLGRGANHDPIVVLYRVPQEAVADCPADFVYLHIRKMFFLLPFFLCFPQLISNACPDTAADRHRY